MSIVLVAEFPCTVCGTALRFPTVLAPESLPVTVNGIAIGPLPEGWTYSPKGVRCPAHQPRLVVPAGAIPPGVLKGT
jgi:hypothetical protein